MVIFSNTWPQHLQHLHSVLGRIKAPGLTLNVQKCEWAKQETKYLGYQLVKGTIRDSARPTTKTQVKYFLCLIKWYRRFIQQCAFIAAPINRHNTGWSIKEQVPDGETPQVKIGTCGQSRLGKNSRRGRARYPTGGRSRLYATRPLVDSGAPCMTSDCTRSSFKQRSIMSQAHGLVGLK